MISNRVPPLGDNGASTAGGLAVALKAALEAKGGGLWMGWSGKTSASDKPGALCFHRSTTITFALTNLPKQDLSEYYSGFANSVLWPLCHYRSDLIDYSRKNMEGYFRVNRYFAERFLPLIQHDDLLWVHDYHLIPMAGELRKLGVKNRIGFFMHIPWPSPDVFFILPVHEQILANLSSYDVVGFQTNDDAENFALALKRLGIGRDLGNVSTGKCRWATVHGRRFRYGVFPIGIATKAVAASAQRSSRNVALRALKESLRGSDVIVGVDRLDYSKGLVQRIKGYGRFLLENPASQNTTTLLQISPKSRSDVLGYADTAREVAEAVGQVNGSIGRLDWMPVRYINHAVSQTLLSGIYRLSKVGLVTPLRDGMNLVAKEYVASQDPEDPGVLVLSQFAGAKNELQDALQVNPYDQTSITHAIARALTMAHEERKQRHARMLAQLMVQDVTKWCHDFVTALEA